MNTPATIMSPESGRVIASCFALAAFAIALLAGLFGGNDAAQILLRAVVVMLVCYPVGVIVGMICDGVIHSQLSAKSADASMEQTASPMGDDGISGASTGSGMSTTAARTESVAAKSRAAA